MDAEKLEKLIQTVDKTIWPAIITAIVTSTFALITLGFNTWSLLKQIKEKKRDERRKEIYAKLNDFYGPFQAYLNTSKELFRIFAIGKPKEFRTLTYLLDPTQKYKDENGNEAPIVLTDVDKELLKEIIKVGKKLETLTVEKSGLVDDAVLRYDYSVDPSSTDVKLKDNGLLTFAKVHFQIIRLANEGKLKGDVSRFKDYVYPRELNAKIETKITELQKELKSLGA